MMARRANITDRAHRYRANQLAPVAGKVCLLCGSTSFLVPDHWDGLPDHTTPDNLEVLCKSCNTAKGAAFKAAGRGRLTKQYNPTYIVLRAGKVVLRTTDHHEAAQRATELKRAHPAEVIALGEKQNPTKGGGAATVGEWMQAVGAITPHVDRGDRGLVSTMSTRDAVDMIRATPQSKRRDFAAKMRRRNPWFSRPDARRTTPASGGIAHHMKRSGATAKKAAAVAGKKSGGPLSVPDEKTLADGFKRGLSLADMLGARNPATERSRVLQDAISHWRQARKKVFGETAKKYDARIKELGRELRQEFKRNPAAASAEVFQEFHGFEPSEVITVTKKVHYHKHLAAAGKLVQLDVWGIDERGHKISGFKGAFLAFNESKNQLFVEGGDQSVNLADFGIDSAHELETLGRLTDIGYQTNKTHLGDEGGEAVYVHKFRTTNDNGKHVVVKIARYPDLIYDVRNEQLLMSGGSYEILREGINK